MFLRFTLITLAQSTMVFIIIVMDGALSVFLIIKEKGKTFNSISKLPRSSAWCLLDEATSQSLERQMARWMGGATASFTLVITVNYTIFLQC